MKDYSISINSFAEYLMASESRQRAILKEQLKVNKIKAQWYQLAKARIKKSIGLSGDLSPVNNGIKTLNARKPEKKNKKIDKECSIEALKKFQKIELPTLIKENKVEVISSELKYLTFYGVRVKLKPTLVFKIKMNGEIHVGACQIHISKRKPFNNSQSKIVTTLLYQYVSNHITLEGEIPNPELCFCIDPFAGTTINSFSNITLDMIKIKEMCYSMHKAWKQVIREMKAA
ncbi:MAG: hypothetical protein ACOZCO_02075 [Bacteroidota bacterium]